MVVVMMEIVKDGISSAEGASDGRDQHFTTLEKDTRDDLVSL